jgi:serine/threonine protein phosphatase PrpC
MGGGVRLEPPVPRNCADDSLLLNCLVISGLLKEAGMSDTHLAAPQHDVTVCAATHPGLIAAHNDDTFVIATVEGGQAARRPAHPLKCFVDSGGVILLVCDGIGGAAGEVAAWLGSEVLVAALRQSTTGGSDPAIRLLHAVAIANREILIEARAAGIELEMGAACTACWISGQRAYFAQVGDSRGYILRDRSLYQATWDQVTDLPVAQMSQEHIRMGEHANVLLHVLGAADHVEAIVTEVDLRQGDNVLLCTDGLHHLLSLDAIRTKLIEEATPCSACQNLVQAAIDRGGPENVTAVIARCDGPVFTRAAPGEAPTYRSRLWSRQGT